MLTLTALLSSCSSSASETSIPESDEPLTPTAIFEAQEVLYRALFEDPPDFDLAMTRMSSDCRAVSDDPAEVTSRVYEEVELAQSADLKVESILDIFSEISYEIDGEVAEGDDGSMWVYEERRWLSTDC